MVVLLPLLKPKLIIFHYNGGKQLPTKVEFVRFLITSMKCKINFQLNGKITGGKSSDLEPWAAIQSLQSCRAILQEKG